jgi:hypothetical protein
MTILFLPIIVLGRFYYRKDTNCENICRKLMKPSRIKLLTFIAALTFCGTARQAFAFETKSESTECSTLHCLGSDYQPKSRQIICRIPQQLHLSQNPDTSTDYFGDEDDDARLRRFFKNTNRKIEPKVKYQYLPSTLFSSEKLGLSAIREVHTDGFFDNSNPALIRIRTVVLIC